MVPFLCEFITHLLGFVFSIDMTLYDFVFA